MVRYKRVDFAIYVNIISFFTVLPCLVCAICGYAEFS